MKTTQTPQKAYYKSWNFILVLAFVILIAALLGIQVGTLARKCTERQVVCDAICVNGGVVVNAVYYRAGEDTQLTKDARNLYIFRGGDLKRSYDPNEPHFFVELEVPVKGQKTYRIWAELPLSLVGEVPERAIMRYDKELGEWQFIKWTVEKV